MPSSSLFLRSSTTLVSALSLISLSSAATIPFGSGSGAGFGAGKHYELDTTYEGASFFDGFSFFTDADPTHGFVDYVSRSVAEDGKLISYGAGQPAKISVDMSPLTPPASIDDYYGKDGVGRKSVRIESTKRWTHGLIILDLNHMPTTSTDGCGTWPAFWTLGSGPWPYNGELDIIEGANDNTKSFSAGHTGSEDKTRQCSVTNNGGSGDLIYPNCNLFTTDPWGNPTNPTGCKIEVENAASYGKPFNDKRGGVYAMEWTSEAIKTYFFPRSSIPADITAGYPDPSTWTPYGVFSTPCDIDSNYNDMNIIINDAFCGDYGDATWGDSCAAKTGYKTCAAYVASKPADFAEAYWEINSLKVYTAKDYSHTTTTSSTATTTWSSTYSTTTTTTTTTPEYTHSTTTPEYTTTTTTPAYTRSTTTPEYTSTSSYSYSRSYSHTGGEFYPTTTTTSRTWSTRTYSTSSKPDGKTTTYSYSWDSTMSWEDWSITSSTPEVTSKTTTTYDPSHTWADWTTSSTPVKETTTLYDPSYTWADWTTSSTPVKETTTTTPYDPSHTWADWTTSSPPAAETTTTPPYDPAHTWADWESTSSVPSDDSTVYEPSTTWADWESSTYSTPAAEATTYSTPADVTSTWADWEATATPADDVPADATKGWPAASSGTGAGAGSWGGASNGTGSYPVSPQTYTGAAGKVGVSGFCLIAAVVALL